MKHLAKNFSILILAVCLAGTAAAAPFKIDTGKGGLLVEGDPGDRLDGPLDFSENLGPRITGKKAGQGLIIGEAAYIDTGMRSRVVELKLRVVHRTVAKAGDAPISTGYLASELLKLEGVTLEQARTVRTSEFNNLPAQMGLPAGSTLVAYEYSGIREQKNDGLAVFLVAISYPGGNKGYAVMGTSREPNRSVFWRDQKDIESAAYKASSNLFRRMRATEN